MSSHDVVAVVRRSLRQLKVGHTGTLDPFATGVLPLVVGQATRLAQFFSGADKEYDARIRLGRSTDSYDLTGKTTFDAPAEAAWPSEQIVRDTLTGFVGPMMQVPPAFSAKMTDGVRAYERARKGLAVDLEAVPVTLRSVQIHSLASDVIDVRLTCSAGFYVRSLAHELGVALGTGAHVERLRRVRSGAFGLEHAVTLDLVPGQGETLLGRVVPLRDLLTGFPAVVLADTGMQYVKNGRCLSAAELAAPPDWQVWPDRVRLLGPDGDLLAIASPAPGGLLHPAIVLM
jgi:tRNA pseudouridine55 synthase